MAKDPPVAKKEGGAEAPGVPAPEKARGAAEDLKADLEAARREKAELFQRLQYLQADFENYRKRAARETEAVVKFAHEALVTRLLPVLDDLDAALASTQGDAAKGVRLVRDNLVKALQEAGLQEIPALGQPFDPYVHDCVQQAPDPEAPEGIVKEVVRKGYRLQDRVLRPAQVIVVQNGGESNG